jgi:hypothetical protein
LITAFNFPSPVHSHSILVSRCEALRAVSSPIQVSVSKETLGVFLHYLCTNKLENNPFTEETIKELALLGSLFNFTTKLPKLISSPLIEKTEVDPIQGVLVSSHLQQFINQKEYSDISFKLNVPIFYLSCFLI